MTDKFGKTQKDWNSVGAQYTAQEIYQQPEVWLKVLGLFTKDQQLIHGNLDKINISDSDIILTGAGTSEFAGAAVVGFLKQQGLQARAIATTDLLSNPKLYLQFKQPTLLVSFARSGNSPESLATVKMIKKILKKKLYTMSITCNNAGELAVISQNWKQNFLFLLPAATNDRGFAMTSSFTSMILWALLTFGPTDQITDQLKQLVYNINLINDDTIAIIQKLANNHDERIVFLGANQLKAFAQEASLKTLELSGGLVTTHFNSPLGFRHGPKSIVNDSTTIFCLLSTNKYTRKYDLDLIKEIYKDKVCANLVVLDYQRYDKIKSFCDYYIYPKTSKKSQDIYAGLFYIYLAQVFALLKSVALKKAPDNPCPTGEVNRVVQGVKIHNYHEK